MEDEFENAFNFAEDTAIRVPRSKLLFEKPASNQRVFCEIRSLE
jgi:hypothetical protein